MCFQVIVDYKICLLVRKQANVLQDLSWVTVPTHDRSSHVLDRVLRPLPHVLLHSDQTLQSLQRPAIKAWNNRLCTWSERHVPSNFKSIIDWLLLLLNVLLTTSVPVAISTFTRFTFTHFSLTLSSSILGSTGTQDRAFRPGSPLAPRWNSWRSRGRWLIWNDGINVAHWLRMDVVHQKYVHQACSQSRGTWGTCPLCRAKCGFVLSVWNWARSNLGGG